MFYSNTYIIATTVPLLGFVPLLQVNIQELRDQENINNLLPSVQKDQDQKTSSGLTSNI